MRFNAVGHKMDTVAWSLIQRGRIESAIADLLYASCVLKRNRAGAVAYDTSYVG
jgi:hypothetical protein